MQNIQPKLTEISSGFSISFNHPTGSLSSSTKYLYCALQHPSVVNQYVPVRGAVLSSLCWTIQHNSHSQCPLQAI